MDDQEVSASVLERETIEDEIKRIQQALGGEADQLSDGEAVDSDEDGTLNDDSDNEISQQQPASTNELNKISEPVPSTNGILSCENISQLDYSDSIEKDNSYTAYSESVEGGYSYLASLSELSDFGLHVPPDYHTCLALNRSYQELITDGLQQIETLLDSIAERETELNQALEDRVSLSAIQPGSLKKKQITSYAIPYFKDVDGMFPPSNQDVMLKKARSEFRAYQMIPSIWQAKHKQELKKAVLADARVKVLRPCMNRKELEVEKLQTAQNEIVNCETKLEMIQRESASNSESENWEEEEEDEKDKSKPLSTKEIKENAARDELTKAREQKNEIHQRIQDIDKAISEKKRMSEKDLLTSIDANQIDWLKISTMEFDGRWDSVSCKQMWTNVQSPSINRTKWSAEENATLQELIVKHDKRNWPKIAQELGTNRTPFQCLQHYELKLNTSHDYWKERTTFTSEEDAQLLEVVSTCKMGNNIPWTQVSFYMEDKTPVQCRLRYKCIDPGKKKGKWTSEEDMLMMAQVYKYGTEHWNIIAKSFAHRTVTQCRERWNNGLNPDIRLGEWSYEEDKQLLTLMKEINSFAKVSQCMDRRTDSQVRKRYILLMKWKEETQLFDEHTDQDLQKLNSLPLHELIQSVKQILFNRTSEQPNKELRNLQGNDGIEVWQVEKNETKEFKDTQVESESTKGLKSTKEAGSDSGMQTKNKGAKEKEVATKSHIIIVSETEPRFNSLDDPRLKKHPLLVDCIKQLRDKNQGNIVVPRPVIFKKTTRHLKKKELRKENLRNAVLEKVLHVMETSETTNKEALENLMATFSNLNKKMAHDTKNTLNHLSPSISVRKMLDIKRSLAEVENKAADQPSFSKRKRRNKAGLGKSSVDEMLKNAVSYASNDIGFNKNGRRKRFFKAEKADPEKQSETRAKTSAILMQTLNTDAQSAWDRLHGQTPDNNLSDNITDQERLGEESRKHSFDCLEHMRAFNLVKTLSSENGHANLNSSTGNVLLSSDRHCKSYDAYVVTASSSGVKAPSKGTQISIANADLSESQRSPSNGSNCKNSEDTMNDVSSPSVENPSSAKNITCKSLRPLPPSSTSLTGLRTLLLSRQRLLSRAGVAHRKSQKPDETAISGILTATDGRKPAHNETKVSESDLSCSKFRAEWLKNVRKTEQYRLFESRFNAIFLWPAFLSSIPILSKTELNGKKDVPKLPEKVQRKKRKKVHWKKRITSPKKDKTPKCTLTPAGKKRGRPSGAKSLRNQLLEAGLKARNQRPSVRLASKINKEQTTQENTGLDVNSETVEDTAIEAGSEGTDKGRGQQDSQSMKTLAKKIVTSKSGSGKMLGNSDAMPLTEIESDKDIDVCTRTIQPIEINPPSNSENQTKEISSNTDSIQLRDKTISVTIQPKEKKSCSFSENETDKDNVSEPEIIANESRDELTGKRLEMNSQTEENMEVTEARQYAQEETSVEVINKGQGEQNFRKRTRNSTTTVNGEKENESDIALVTKRRKRTLSNKRPS